MTPTLPAQSVQGQNLPNGFTLPRWPQTDDELYYFVQAIWGIRIPRYVVCKDHVSPFTAFSHAYFARDPVSVWKASRGFGGKTQTLSALVNTEAVCLAADSSILGGSAAQSINVHAASTGFWHHYMAPRHLLRDEPTKYDTYLTNGAYIRSLMASQASVRGPHPQRLRLDEIDEMDMSILQAAQGQPMRKRKAGKMVETQTVMSSTHQYADGTMSQTLSRAEEQGWPIFQWCWKECANPKDGWLKLDEVVRKRKEIPKAMWDAEYDLQEPSFEGRAFDVEAIEQVFHSSTVTDKLDWVFKAHKINPNKRLYVTAVDWAKERDKTVIATYWAESEPWWCVELQVFNRVPWPLAVRRAENQYRKYGGVFIHDATGIGNVISDYFDPRLIKSDKFKDFVMTAGRARADLFTEYITAIEDRKIHYPRMNYVYNEHRFCTNDDLYGKGHPPDSVVAGALAWYARRILYKGALTSPFSIEREASPWDLSVNTVS